MAGLAAAGCVKESLCVGSPKRGLVPRRRRRRVEPPFGATGELLFT